MLEQQQGCIPVIWAQMRADILSKRALQLCTHRESPGSWEIHRRAMKSLIGKRCCTLLQLRVLEQSATCWHAVGQQKHELDVPGDMLSAGGNLFWKVIQEI